MAPAGAPGGDGSVCRARVSDHPGRRLAFHQPEPHRPDGIPPGRRDGLQGGRRRPRAVRVRGAHRAPRGARERPVRAGALGACRPPEGSPSAEPGAGHDRGSRPAGGASCAVRRLPAGYIFGPQHRADGRRGLHPDSARHGRGAADSRPVCLRPGRRAHGDASADADRGGREQPGVCRGGLRLARGRDHLLEPRWWWETGVSSITT